MDKNTIYIRFFKGVDQNSVNKLMETIEQKLTQKVERFIILISSPGGSVLHGLSAYNFLRGIPAEVITHNFGSVDSIATVLYCAGSKRLCVPHGRFLLHGIGFNVSANARFNEKVLDEHMKRLRNERETISRVIADSAKHSEQEVEKTMFEGTVLTAQQAKNYGLVNEIKSELFEKNAKVINI